MLHLPEKHLCSSTSGKLFLSYGMQYDILLTIVMLWDNSSSQVQQYLIQMQKKKENTLAQVASLGLPCAL